MDIDSTFHQLVTEVKSVEAREGGRSAWWRVEFFDGVVRIIDREDTGMMWVYIERAEKATAAGNEDEALAFLRSAAAIAAVLNEAPRRGSVNMADLNHTISHR